LKYSRLSELNIQDPKNIQDSNTKTTATSSLLAIEYSKSHKSYFVVCCFYGRVLAGGLDALLDVSKA